MKENDDLKFIEDTIKLLNENQNEYEFILASTEEKIGEIHSFTNRLPIGIRKKDSDFSSVLVFLADKKETPEETYNCIMNHFDEIIDKFNNCPIPNGDIDKFVEDICTSEYLKENVIPTIQNSNIKDKYLEDKINIPFFDMKILFKIQLIKDFDEENTSVIEVFLTKDLLNIIKNNEGIELSTDEILEYAKNNIINKQHIELKNLDDYMMDRFKELYDVMGEKFIDTMVDDLSNIGEGKQITKEDLVNFIEDMYGKKSQICNHFILSNSDNIDCTGLILNESVLKMFSNSFGEDFGIVFLDEKKLVIAPISELKNISLNSLKDLKDNSNMISNKVIIYSSEENEFSEYVGSLEGIKA